MKFQNHTFSEAGRTGETGQDLAEAHWIITELAVISDRLKSADQRFVETSRSYLENAGAGAEVGKWRLESLCRVAEEYGVFEHKRA